MKTKLENWSVWVLDDNMSKLFGCVFNHPRLNNGQGVFTAPIVTIDTKNRVSLTESREYQLGAPDPSWLDHLERNNIELSSFDKLK